MKVFLCGHTGSINRGCEAIARSTANILRMCGAESVELLTFNPQYDIRNKLDEDITLHPYPEKNLLEKVLVGIHKVLKKNTFSGKLLYKKTFKNIDKHSTVLFNIGGDTYCYKPPYISYALNDYAKKRHIPNVFWGCSVDTNALEDSQMAADLNKYSYITVRESLSEEILQKIVKDNRKLLRICDPAFHLSIKEIPLPDGFIVGNTVGLNVSPMVFRNADDLDDIMYHNAHALIDHILATTDMSVCLIPHVYDYDYPVGDAITLKRIYDKYTQNPRVSLITDSLSAPELKYIISKCRFFIGARTHSTIAAYSTEVPCIALSYSIKSRGIAKDLFGTEEGFALPHENITTDTALKDAFINILLNKEDDIRCRYREILPAYKQSIITQTKKMLQELSDDRN